MKKIAKMLALAIIIVAIICTGNMASAKLNNNAKSKNKKALQAYSEMLEDEEYAKSIVDLQAVALDKCQFALLDINNDGIKELIFTPDKGYHVDIVAYVDSKITRVGWGYAGDELFYPKKNIYKSTTTNMGSDETYYYKFNGKKMVKVAYKIGEDRYNAVTGKEKKESEWDTYEPYRYEIKDKVVSKKKYDKYIKKLMSGAKNEKVKYKKNTNKNRGKYLG